MAAIGSNPFDSLHNELIPVIASFFDNFDTHIRFSHTCLRFFGAATDLNASAKKLIDYTAKRGLIQSEGMFFLSSHHLPIIPRSTEADHQMQLFYDSFKKRMTELHIGTLSEQFFTVVTRVTKLMVTLSTQPNASPELGPAGTPREAVRRLLVNLESSQLSEIKIGTLTTAFQEKAAQDAMQSYAKQPLDAITPSSMEKMLALVNTTFDSIAEIVRKHHSKEKMASHRQGFLDKSPTAHRFLEAQERIRVDLICQRYNLKERMAALPGEIEKARENKERVEKEAEAKIAASAKLDQLFVSLIRAERPSENRSAMEDALGSILKVFDELSQQKEEAVRQHQQLLDEQSDIPETAGRIQEALRPENLKQAAREECEKMAQFLEFFLEDS